MQVQAMISLCLPGRSSSASSSSYCCLMGSFCFGKKSIENINLVQSHHCSDDFFNVSLAWAILPFHSLALVPLRVCASEFLQNLPYKTNSAQR